MQPSVAEHGQEYRVPPRGAGHGDAQIGLLLREAKDIRAPDEHRGRSLASVELAAVDLTDVGDDIGLGAARPMNEVGQATQQLVVRYGLQARTLFHGPTIAGPGARTGPIPHKLDVDDGLE